MSKARKKIWKENVAAIRRILIADWNPIGFSVPDDEYDSYIPTLYRLIQTKADIAEVAFYLEHVETEFMGLCPRSHINLVVAKQLLDITIL